MGDRLRVGIPSRYVTSQLALHPYEVAKSSTSFGWECHLCRVAGDPMWHVSSRSGVATLRTAIHLLLTYPAYLSQGRDISLLGRVSDVFSFHIYVSCFLPPFSGILGQMFANVIPLC